MAKKRAENIYEDKRVKKSLVYSILDGSFYSAMVGFGESFLSAFAVFLKATNFQIGLLGSLPMMLGSVFQLFSRMLLSRFKSRKKMILFGALLQALMFIPIGYVFYLGELKVFHLIVFVCLYWIFGMMGGPAWNSWMGDIVNPEERGKYFGRRNKIAGLVYFATFMGGGYLLEHFSTGIMMEYLGFAILFAISFISRIVSFVFLSMKYEPRYRIVKKGEFTFIEFLKQARFRNYGLFVIYYSVMNFAVYVAAPFFTPYMLNELEFSYMTFTIVTGTALVVKYLMMPIWGRMCDRYGTKKVLAVSGFLMPILPILWIFSGKVWYLMIVQILSGIFWAGFEISSANFIFDTTTSPKRATCVAYYNVLNGIAIFAGGMLGVAIMKYNPISVSVFFMVFIISFILRYAASFIFLPKLREVREVKHISDSKLVMKVLTAMPTEGLINNIIVLKNITEKQIKKQKRAIITKRW